MLTSTDSVSDPSASGSLPLKLRSKCRRKSSDLKASRECRLENGCRSYWLMEVELNEEELLERRLEAEGRGWRWGMEWGTWKGRPGGFDESGDGKCELRETPFISVGKVWSAPSNLLFSLSIDCFSIHHFGEMGSSSGKAHPRPWTEVQKLSCQFFFENVRWRSVLKQGIWEEFVIEIYTSNLQEQRRKSWQGLTKRQLSTSARDRSQQHPFEPNSGLSRRILPIDFRARKGQKKSQGKKEEQAWRDHEGGWPFHPSQQLSWTLLILKVFQKQRFEHSRNQTNTLKMGYRRFSVAMVQTFKREEAKRACSTSWLPHHSSLTIWSFFFGSIPSPIWRVEWLLPLRQSREKRAWAK